MATKRRAGLGRGLGALIPQAPASDDRAIDVFFNGSAPSGRQDTSRKTDTETQDAKTAPVDAQSEVKKGTRKSTTSKTPATKTSTRGASTKTASAKSAPSKTSPAKTAPTKSVSEKSAPEKSVSEKSTRNSSSRTTTASPTTAIPGSLVESNIVDSTISVDSKTGEILQENNPQVSTDLSTVSSTVEIDPDAAASGNAITVDEAESINIDELVTSSDSESTHIDVVDDVESADDIEAEPAEGLLPIPGVQLANLDPFRIVANTRQPRTEFDQEALEELTHSVREFGVFQPIVVRPMSEDDPRRAEGEFELIMGERRLRATKASGRTSIPAIIRHTEDDAMLRDALLENLHRAELNPLEEASAYQQLLDDFGCSQQELSERIGRSRPRISNTIRLLKLPVDVQRKVAAGVLSAGHARAVLSVGEPAAMTQLANKIINENLTVREAEMAAATMSIRTDRPATKPSQVGSDSLNAHLSTVGERLGDRLNTRVKVVLRKTKGQISIDFASVADLNRILEAIGESTDY